MTFNPFDWSGEAFLALYLSLMAATSVWIIACRGCLGPNEDRDPSTPLIPPEIAWLRCGAQRAADTFLLRAFSIGGAVLETSSPGFYRGKPGIVFTNQLPPELAEVAIRPLDCLSLEGFRVAVMPAVTSMSERLKARGLAPDARALDVLLWRTMPVIGAVIVTGAIKISIGLSRHRPVGILCFLVLITLIAGLIALASAPRATRAGRATLEREFQRNQRAARAPTDIEVPLAFAFMGPAVLPHTSYAALAALYPNFAGGSGGCGGSGGGDGGGGGGGGGSGCGGCSS